MAISKLSDAMRVAIGGYTVTVGLAVWKYVYELCQRRRENRLQRVNAQLKDLYGPLYALIEAMEKSRDSFFAQYDQSNWKRKDQTMPEEHKRAWMAWVLRQYETTNQRVYELIISNARLYADNRMPEGFHAFIAHHLQYRELLVRWQSHDFSVLFSTVPYPGFAIAAHVRETFVALKDLQMALLANRNRTRSSTVRPEPVGREMESWDTESPM